MLSTVHTDNLFNPLSAHLGDTMLWRRVTLELNEPYFFLESEINEHGVWIGQTQILGSLHDLLALCRLIGDRDDMRVRQVTLMSPSWMNKTDAWQIHPIHQIGAATIVGSGIRVHTYRTLDGNEFVDERNDFPVEALIEVEVVFSSE